MYRNVSFVNHRSVAKTLLLASMIFISAQIVIPITPVPITLQTVSILLIGYLCDKKTAINSVVMYLIGGISGIPVFAGYHSGLAYFCGPTGGYLVGFLMCVIAMTYLKDFLIQHLKYFKFNTYIKYIFLGTVGTFVIYSCGILWLTTFVGFKKAIIFGLMPFILPGIVKLFILSFLIKKLKGAI